MADQKDQSMAAHWKSQIGLCDKENRRWHKRGKIISEKYRDDRGATDEITVNQNRRTLNLFWSNVQTLKPATYSKAPVPICERRFLDKDTTGRVASTILERALRYEVSMSGFHNSVLRARDDRLLPGRGQVWVRYNPKFGEPISEKQKGEDEIQFEGSEQPQDLEQAEDIENLERELVSESLAVDYLHWQDYYTFPPKARTEDEVEGKGRRLFMSRQDLIERFGDEGKKVPLDHVPNDDQDTGSAQSSSGVSQDQGQATVFEIWWKPERKVYFIAREYDKCLIPEGFEEDEDGIPDPLRLEGFFPCPPPLNATMTNDTLIPVPDYVESQDQYVQIDELTKRIDVLTNACKVRGVYDAGAQGVKRIFEEASEPSLIPVESWAMFAEKGGLKGAIDWVPIEQIATTLQILIEVRAKIIEDLDRTTGIWDIMRGTSDARETLGGQRLKQNNGTGRLQDRQDEIARFCRDIISIMGEIIAEHYDPQTLIQVSGAMYDEGLDPPDIPPQLPSVAGLLPIPGQPQPQQGALGQAAPAGVPIPPQESPEQKEQRKLEMILQAIGLLRNDKLRGFRIDIETDSTIQGDAQEEKAARIEFVTGVTKFVEVAAQITVDLPAFAPLAAKMLQFAVRGFRVGRDLESAIEDFAEKAEMDAKKAAANPQAKVNPEEVKQQTEKIKQAGEIRTQEVEAKSEQTNAAIRLKEEEIKANNDRNKNAFEFRKMERQEQFEIAQHERRMEELKMQKSMKADA